MSDTPILTLPEIAESQAGKAITHNEALNRLEGMLVRVLSATTTAEPGSPSEGDTYILPASATGTDWAGNDGKIAHYYGGAWHFYAPVTGLGIYSTGDAKIYRYNGSAWAEDAGGVSVFTGLTDTPSSYSGAANKLVAVNSGASALEFIANPAAATPYDTFATYLDSLSPSGWWRLGEASGTTAADEQAANDGIYESSPTLGEPGLVKDDADTAVDFGASADMKITDGGALFGSSGTLFFLAKPNWSAGDSTSHVLFDAGEGGGNNHIIVQKYTDNQWYVGWVTGGASHRIVVSDSLFTFTSGNTYALAVTWDDSADETRFYVDGVLIAQNVSTQSYPDISSQHAYLSVHASGATYGNIVAKDLATFGSVLTQARIATLSLLALSGAPEVRTSGRNFLLNPNFSLNQRGFAGGSLSEGDYGFDRWRASRAAHRGYAAKVLELGPSNWWRLNEASGTTAKDIVGDHDLLIVGGVTLAQAALANDGDPSAAAMRFNGSSGYLSHDGAGPPSGWLTDPAAFSFACLVQLDVIQASTILRAAVGSNSPYHLVLHSSNNKFRMDKYPPSGGELSGQTAPSIDTVYHLVYVETSGWRKIYLNGVLDNTDNSPETYTGGNADSFFIGATGAANFLDGYLSEIVLFTRALNAGEVAALDAASGLGA